MTQAPITDARILVVDDQENNVVMLDALLGQAGYTQVRGITDPRNAVAAFRGFAPDLVLLDLLMPHLDGFGVMAQLRPLLPASSYLPILVLTADMSGEVKRRALAEGATDFLAKPLDTIEVLLRIRNLLQTRAFYLQLQDQNELLEARVQERTRALEERTRELEEARTQVLDLYRELARRNLSLQDTLERMLRSQEPGGERRAAAAAARTRRVGAGVERLTPREQEVLHLLAQGRTNNEIARELVLSLTTVKFHVEHIIAKLGVTDRTQAAVRAVELGLLADP
jgi:DNA-binding NarL/FixJ family response regulator